MLGTGDRAEETDLAPALEVLTEQRVKQSRPQSRLLQGREMGAVLQGWGWGSRSAEGAPNPALAGGTLALQVTAEHSAQHMPGSRMGADRMPEQ